MAVLPFRSLFTLHVLSFSVFFNLGTFPTVSHVSSLAWNSQRKTGRRNKKDNKRYKSDSSMNATASLLLSSTAGHSDNSIFLNAACHCHDLCTAALQESDCRSVFVFHCFPLFPDDSSLFSRQPMGSGWESNRAAGCVGCVAAGLHLGGSCQ